MNKVHRQFISLTKQPFYMSDADWRSQTVCGYVRDKVTRYDKKVTCFYCKRLIDGAK